jgi:hypothetical protein
MTDPTTTRNVLIIYGFFFVMLAALLSAAIQTMSMDSVTRFLIYILSWSFALASAFIGLGSLELLENVPAMISAGFFILVVVVPTSFLIVIGQLLLRDSGIIVYWGSISFVAILFVILIVLYIRANRRMKGPLLWTPGR